MSIMCMICAVLSTPVLYQYLTVRRCIIIVHLTGARGVFLSAHLQCTSVPSGPRANTGAAMPGGLQLEPCIRQQMKVLMTGLYVILYVDNQEVRKKYQEDLWDVLNK